MTNSAHEEPCPSRSSRSKTNRRFVDFLRVSLNHHRYQLIEAETGAMGIRKVAEEQPDLIVLDLGLPD